MSTTTASPEDAPLDEVMLAMDVADTLRHRGGFKDSASGGDAREAALLDELREIYRQQGIAVTDAVLREGVKALEQRRFTYEPPRPGIGTALARLYIARRLWGPPALALTLMLAIGFGGYFLAWRPFQDAQAEARRVELADTLPGQMDALDQTIFEETKVQEAANDADQLKLRGKAAAAAGDRVAAERAVTELTALRDRLRQEYTLRIVNRPEQKTMVWRTPPVNTAATNYYVVVEAIGAGDKPLAVPVVNEESGKTETVSTWAVRVPEAIYSAIEADLADDGALQRSVLGIKEFGFLDIDYVLPVLGGAITRW